MKKSIAKHHYEAVVIGVSAGGMEALRVILPTLPQDYALAVMVVAHRHKDSDHYMVDSLNSRCAMRVKEADEKEAIRPGTVYVAPANYHLMVEEDNTLSLTVDEHVKYSRPSIDMLFETAARAYGPKLIGVVLTGANADGSDGLREIKQRGGYAMVQDPNTAQVDTMPREAIKATVVDRILPLDQIGPCLVGMGSGES